MEEGCDDENECRRTSQRGFEGTAPASCPRKPPHGQKGSALFRSRSRSSQQSLAEQKSSFPVRYLEPGKMSDMSRISMLGPSNLFGYLFRNKAVFFLVFASLPAPLRIWIRIVIGCPGLGRDHQRIYRSSFHLLF